MTTGENEIVSPLTRGDSKFTWDDAIAAIGKDFSEGPDHVADEVIDSVAVTRYCEVWEIGNPLYWDANVAKQAGYKDLLVPWSAIKQTFSYRGSWRPGEPTRFPSGMGKDDSTQLGSFSPAGKPIPAPRTTVGVFTDMVIEFFEPVCVGDQMTVKGNKLVNVRPRKTRIGDGAFLNRESEWYNQRGQLVARAISGGFSYNTSPEGQS